MTLTYAQIKDRLEEIEQDLADRQSDYEEAAAKKHKLARDFELRQARAFMAARGETATERKAQATIALAAAGDGIYGDVSQIEGEYEGLKAAVRLLETRASIGQSLLRAAQVERGG